MIRSTEQIGLFGGTFDPVHFGHLSLARAALTELQLDRVLFVPAAQNPLKPAGAVAAPGIHRLAMLEIALAGYPEFAAAGWELERGGNSFTIDTLQRARREFPEAVLYLLLGADSFTTLPDWKQIDGFGRLCRIAVANRPGTELERGCIDELLEGLELDYVQFTMAPDPVSSSLLRDLIRSGESISELVPAAVDEYISLNGLYSDG